MKELEKEFQQFFDKCFHLATNADNDIYNYVVRPLLQKYELACLSPFFPVYSLQRLSNEKISRNLIISAFIHVFRTRKQTPEEKYLCTNLINEMLCDARLPVVRDYMNLCVLYDEKIRIKAHPYTNLTLPVKEVLQSHMNQSHSHNDSQFMAICFGTFKDVNYCFNPCVLQPMLLPTTARLIATISSMQLVDCETIVKRDVFDEKLSLIAFRNKSDGNFSCRPGTKAGVIGIDVCLPKKFADANNKTLVFPEYEATVFASMGDELFQTDSRIDQFLFNLHNKELVQETRARASELFRSIYTVFKRKLACDIIVSMVMILEQRLSPILLWKHSPLSFRQICLNENALCYPLMMPFNQSAYFKIDNIMLSPKDEPKSTMFARFITRIRKDTKEDLEAAVYAWEKISTPTPISRETRIFLPESMATNAILIRSNRQKNGPLQSIELIAEGMIFFRGSTDQTLVEIDNQGYEWHACSLCRLSSNQHSITETKTSNIRINQIFDTTALTYAVLELSWDNQPDYEFEKVDVYFRDFNCVRQCNNLYGKMFT